MLNFEWFGKEEQRHRHTRKTRDVEDQYFSSVSHREGRRGSKWLQTCLPSSSQNLKMTTDPFLIIDYCNLRPAKASQRWTTTSHLLKAAGLRRPTSQWCLKMTTDPFLIIAMQTNNYFKQTNNYFASIKGSSRVEAAYLPVMQPQFVTVRASPTNGSSSNLQQTLKQTYNLQHALRACKQEGKLPQLL